MDTLDSLAGASFDDVYAKDIEPELQLREADRRKALETFGLVLLAGVLLVIVEMLLLPSSTSGRFDVRAAEVWLGTLVAAGVLGYLPVRGVAKATKADVLGALCKPLGVAYEAGDFDAPSFQTFLELHLLPKPDDKSFEDHFTGERGGHAFEICEATLAQGTGRNRSIVFRGQIFRIAFPKASEGVTVVLRNSGWLNRFECPPGLARVGLEDPKFEQIFEVYGSDQVAARVILTPTFMEQVLALEAAYAGEHIRCAFVRGDLLIALEGKDRFEIGSMFTSLVDRGRIEAVARNLAAVFKLIDSFVSSGLPLDSTAGPTAGRRSRKREDGLQGRLPK
jgi:Protein of unknown function (DUF3137)